MHAHSTVNVMLKKIKNIINEENKKEIKYRQKTKKH